MKQKPLNPVDKNGDPQLCVSCGSYRHMLRDCPDSWENLCKDALAADPEPNSGNGNPEMLVVSSLPMILLLKYYTQEL